MSKPGKVLKALCKRLGVRLTVKRGKKRVYKSVTVLKAQCNRKAKKKKKKKVKRKRKFGARAVAKHRGLPRDLERHIDSYLRGTERQRIQAIRARLMNELVVRRNPPLGIRRQVAQRINFEDDGFGNEF